MKQFSAASERNRQPILDVLLRLLPSSGHALEIASGTGQHVAHFAQHLPGWNWQPTDMGADGFESIAAWCQEAGAHNVAAAVLLDVSAACWPSPTPTATATATATIPPHLCLDTANETTIATPFDTAFDLIFCANMLHISPWATCAGLMQGAAQHLSAKGVLVTYGPYLERDVPTSPGNLAFDESLRRRNPQWGIRALEDVVREAKLAGLELKERMEMPANNLLLVFGIINSYVNKWAI